MPKRQAPPASISDDEVLERPFVPNLRADSDLLRPLADCYQASGLVLPRFEYLAGEELAEPYRSLLAHTRDMTPTLEQFHGDGIHLRLLQSFRNRLRYTREVVLLLDGTDASVEYGAIRIHLPAFANEAQRLILEGKVPLGTILDRCAIVHTCRPKGFFRMQADDRIGEALGLSGRRILHGRSNGLYDSAGKTLAEIVEILPPQKEGGSCDELR
jgi:hypothetical protein